MGVVVPLAMAEDAPQKKIDPKNAKNVDKKPDGGSQPTEESVEEATIHKLKSSIDNLEYVASKLDK